MNNIDGIINYYEKLLERNVTLKYIDIIDFISSNEDISGDVLKEKYESHLTNKQLANAFLSDYRKRNYLYELCVSGDRDWKDIFTENINSNYDGLSNIAKTQRFNFLTVLLRKKISDPQGLNAFAKIDNEKKRSKDPIFQYKERMERQYRKKVERMEFLCSIISDLEKRIEALELEKQTYLNELNIIVEK